MEFPTPDSFRSTNPNAFSRRRALLAALTVWPTLKSLTAQSQTTPSKPDFSTDVKVVNVFATVRDKEGKIVRNLTKNDFVLREDDRPQTIPYFSQQSDLPLTLGLLVDTSRSERRMLGSEKDASRAFLEKVLREDLDHAFLIHFDQEIELLQDLTSSRAKLERALDLLDASGNDTWTGRPSGGGQRGGWGGSGGRRSGGGGSQGPGAGRHGFGGGTAFYDAIYLAANDVLKSQTGRKAVIMLTDGEDNASKISLSEAISTAQRSDTLAYSIRVADEENASFGYGGFGGFPGGRGGMGSGRGRGRRGPLIEHGDGKKILLEISEKTGASYHEYSKKTPLSQIYAEIEEELRNQYSIGYTSDRPQTETGFRKIALTVRDKKLQVRAREGYYAGNAT